VNFAFRRIIIRRAVWSGFLVSQRISPPSSNRYNQRRLRRG
jgi:hypothetical protein